MNYFCRITIPYDACKGFNTLVCDCTALLAVQHDADDEVQRTHVHFLLLGYRKSEETLRLRLRDMGSSTDLSGNALYAKQKYDGAFKTLVYMTKDKYDLIFVKQDEEYWRDRFSDELVDASPTEPLATYLRSMWEPNDLTGNALYYKQAFDGWTPPPFPLSTIPDDDDRYDINKERTRWYKNSVKRRCREIGFLNGKNFWTPKSRYIYDMLYNTYMMRNAAKDQMYNWADE